MNCDGKMSLGTFLFRVNPQILRITYTRTAAEAAAPYAPRQVTDMNGGGRRITGEGEFYGEDCEQQFAALRQRFESGGSAILYVPSQPPMLVVPVSLELTGRDAAGVIGYRFTVLESPAAGAAGRLTQRIADGQHSLWDYAYESGLPIGTLQVLNPAVMRPDVPIPIGRRVSFC